MSKEPSPLEWMIYLEDRSKYLAEQVRKRNPNVKTLKEFQKIMNSKEFRDNYQIGTGQGFYDAILNPNTPGSSKVYDKILEEYAKITDTKVIQTTVKDYFESSKELTKWINVSPKGNKSYIRASPMNWTPEMKEWVAKKGNVESNARITEEFNMKFNTSASIRSISTMKYRVRGTQDKGKHKISV